MRVSSSSSSPRAPATTLGKPVLAALCILACALTTRTLPSLAGWGSQSVRACTGGTCPPRFPEGGRVLSGTGVVPIRGCPTSDLPLPARWDPSAHTAAPEALQTFVQEQLDNFDLRNVVDLSSGQALAAIAQRLGLKQGTVEGSFARKACAGKEGWSCPSLLAFDVTSLGLTAAATRGSVSSTPAPFLATLLAQGARREGTGNEEAASGASLRASLYSGKLVVLLFSSTPAQLDILRSAVCADILQEAHDHPPHTGTVPPRNLNLHPLPDLGVVALYVTVPGRPVVRPPVHIPPALFSSYTLSGQVPVILHHISEVSTSEGAKPPIVYTRAAIDAALGKARRRENNYYGALDGYLYTALDRYPITSKRVFVMGSLEPWYEVVALQREAGSITIVEYGERISEEPRFVFWHPTQLDELLAESGPADVAFSISSFEHDGLGRYGDPLDGEADIRALQLVRDKLLRPGGLLFLSVPVGPDCLVWNAHRVYGKKRLPRLFEGWEVVDTVGLKMEDMEENWRDLGYMDQPIIVLRAPVAT
jgi:hypothetical protein